MRSNDILLRLSAFLIGGDYTYASERRLERLAPTTVTSYKLFVRKFMEAIIQGLVQGHGEEEILTESKNDETYNKLVLSFFKLEHINQFVRDREKNSYVGCSQVNLMCALLWHCSFIQHLIHPRVPTATWDLEDLHLRQILWPQHTASRNEHAITELRESLADTMRYLRQHVNHLKQTAC